MYIWRTTPPDSLVAPLKLFVIFKSTSSSQELASATTPSDLALVALVVPCHLRAVVVAADDLALTSAMLPLYLAHALVSFLVLRLSLLQDAAADVHNDFALARDPASPAPAVRFFRVRTCSRSSVASTGFPALCELGGVRPVRDEWRSRSDVRLGRAWCPKTCGSP